MLDHTVFDAHLLYALATLGALLLLRGAWSLLARTQPAQAPDHPPDLTSDIAALDDAVQRYALTLDVFDAPPAEPEVLETTLAHQLSRIVALQRQLLPGLAERGAQLQAAHGRLMDFLWQERVQSIRHDRHTRHDPAVFEALSRDLRNLLQEFAAGCGHLARDAVAPPQSAAALA